MIEIVAISHWNLPTLTDRSVVNCNSYLDLLDLLDLYLTFPCLPVSPLSNSQSRHSFSEIILLHIQAWQIH